MPLVFYGHGIGLAIAADATRAMRTADNVQRLAGRIVDRDVEPGAVAHGSEPDRMIAGRPGSSRVGPLDSLRYLLPARIERALPIQE